MLKKFKASNGIIVEYSPLIYSLSVIKDDKPVMVTTLLHQHFDEATFRNAFGKYDRDTRKALQEFCGSIGIEKANRGRKSGKKNKIKKIGR
jgi:hypothetical protein